MASKKIKPKIKRIIIISSIVLVIVGAIGVVTLISEYNYRFKEAILKDENLKIYPGTTFAQVSEQLEKDGIIKDSKDMLRYALRHDRDTVQVGNYDLVKGSSYRTLFNTIATGRQTPIRITFNNFRTVDRLVGAVAKRTLCDSQSLMKVMLNDSLVSSKGFKRETLISMFIPNTYEIYWTITPEEFFEKMYQEYDDFWGMRRRSKAESLGFTKTEIATIASIVASETNKEDEMTNVAGVYINRLRKGMPLQADPTVKFALQDFGIRRLLNKHLKVESPYNTYKNKGLPPGPICMPSIAAIDATLDYEGHNYLYFCAKADFSGYHSFAGTLEEHGRNAREYHRELNRRKIK